MYFFLWRIWQLTRITIYVRFLVDFQKIITILLIRSLYPKRVQWVIANKPKEAIIFTNNKPTYQFVSFVILLDRV